MGVFSWLIGEKTLYYPGCLTKVFGEQFDNYKEIFNRLGVDFILMSDVEMCCGLPVMSAGYRKDVRKLARKNFEIFKKEGIRKIITNCPSCYHMFGEVYPDLVREWDIKVEHATTTILKAIKKKNSLRFFRGRGVGVSVGGVSDEDREDVYYHDPCHLGRFSGIYDEPREVIELLGGNVLEFRNNRENAICCGGGGGVRANFPEVAKGIARDRVSEVGDKKIISPCGMCYSNLKSATENSLEFSDFVVRRLRGAR